MLRSQYCEEYTVHTIIVAVSNSVAAYAANIHVNAEKDRHSRVLIVGAGVVSAFHEFVIENVIYQLGCLYLYQVVLGLLQCCIAK